MNDPEESAVPDGVQTAIRQLLRCHKRMLVVNGKTRKSSVAQMRQVHEKLYRMVVEYKKRNRVLKNGYRRLDMEINALRFSVRPPTAVVSVPRPVTIMRDQSTSTSDGQSSMVLFRRISHLETENVKLRKSQHDLLNIFFRQSERTDAVSSAVLQQHRNVDIQATLVQANRATLSLPVLPDDSKAVPDLYAFQLALQRGVEHMLGEFDSSMSSVVDQTKEYASRLDAVRDRIHDGSHKFVPRTESVLVQAEQCKSELGDLRTLVNNFFTSAQSEMRSELERVLEFRCDRSPSADFGVQVEVRGQQSEHIPTRSPSGEASCCDCKQLRTKCDMQEAKYNSMKRNSRAAEQALADIYNGLGVPLPNYPVPFRNGRYAIADRDLSRMLGLLRDVTLEAADIAKKHIRDNSEQQSSQCTISQTEDAHPQPKCDSPISQEAHEEMSCPISSTMKMVSQWKYVSSNVFLHRHEN